LAQYRATTAGAFRAGQRDGSIRPESDVEVETERIITDGLGLALRWTPEPGRVDFVAEIIDWR
jgi:hypothetical protein